MKKWVVRFLVLATCLANPADAQRISQTALEEAKLVARNGTLFDQFGTSVDVYGDLCVVGAPQHATAGAAHVFERTGSGWLERATLTPSDGQDGDHFGHSVAIDRDTILVGAPFDDEPCFASGSAYVFLRSTTGWIQRAKLVPSDSSCNAWFGSSVSLSDEAAVIGASGDQTSGAAYVFEQFGAKWREQRKLVPNDLALLDEFGRSVATGHGVAIIGSPNDDDNGTDSGSAYVFARAGSTWSQFAKLTPSGGSAGERFGWSLSLSEDRVVVGSPGDFSSGAAFVFVRTPTGWTESARLASPGAGFGTAVSTSGGMALVGAPLEDAQAINAGAAYLFIRNETGWSTPIRLTASDGAFNAQLGSAVDLCDESLLVGAPLDNENGSSSGSAYAFRLLLSPIVYCTAKVNSLGCTTNIGSDGIPSARAEKGFTVFAKDVRNQMFGQLLYTLNGPNSTPFQGGTLCLALPIKRTPALSSGGSNLLLRDCSGGWRIDMSSFCLRRLWRQPQQRAACSWQPGALPMVGLRSGCHFGQFPI